MKGNSTLLSTVCNPTLCRWEKVRELAMSKQTELHRLVMKLQVNQMQELKCWMSEAEDKLSQIGGTGRSPSEVSLLLSSLSVLLSELEEQQGVVSGISHFILVDGPDSSPGSLEDELAALGERWVTLCRVCEERQETLGLLAARWDQYWQINNDLTNWMDKVEDNLKQMELDEEPDQAELARQSQEVMVSTEESTELCITVKSQFIMSPVIRSVRQSSQYSGHGLAVQTLQYGLSLSLSPSFSLRLL